MTKEDGGHPEIDCEAATSSWHAAAEIGNVDANGSTITPDELIEDASVAAVGLGPKGGGWGGASNPVSVAARIGIRNGLVVTSRKRSSGSRGSDHHTSQSRSDAVDLSNGSAPTPAMDRTARQIAARLGVPNWQYGMLKRTINGYRVQLLYRTNVGGNHFNHVHVGVRIR